MRLCNKCADEFREGYKVEIRKPADWRKKEKCDKCGKMRNVDECAILPKEGK